MSNLLYHENYAAMLLGCIFKNLEILWNPQFPLSIEDFNPDIFHKILFASAVKLAENGCKEVGSVEIDNFLQEFPKKYAVAQDYNFMDFIETVKSLGNLENYEMYYFTVRKCSLLRDLENNGYSIAKYLNREGEIDFKLLNSSTIPSIIDRFESRTLSLRQKYDTNYVKEELKVGENTQELLAMFEETPSFGAFLQSPFLSNIYNGWCQGHLILRAGVSGAGKSRLATGDLCKVGAISLYNSQTETFEDNANYNGPSLFIATEQKLREEIEPMFLACVAQVEYRKIINGELSKEEKDRVLIAGKILRKSEIMLVSMPDFDIKNIERKIKESAINNGTRYLVFDYLEHQSAAAQEYKTLSGSAGREDQVLKYLTGELKRIAEEFNVGILTGQQLSINWQDKTFLDESVLAGGKSTKNKIDCGSVIVPCSYRKKDLVAIKPYLEQMGIGVEPNICEYIFKSRYGVYGDRKLKIWSYFDKGTFERIDYFVTDENNEVQMIPKAELRA